jgi:hypothetical protein
MSAERPSYVSMPYHELIDERDALRAELSALKARRCDGCAHSVPAEEGAREWHDNAWRDATYVVCSRPFGIDLGDMLVWPDHYCAAWTEKP